jgi:hypothetical protein
MTTFARSGDLRGAEFAGADLRGDRFTEADLSGAVMRGVNADGMDIDDPFLGNGMSVLRVNGVDVVPFVEAELNRRFPGRAARRAADPDGLRAAWAAAEQAWTATLTRVAATPAGTADARVGGEWSFAQTLRHLVHATDLWLGRAVRRIEQPFHPVGLPHAGDQDASDQDASDQDATDQDAGADKRAAAIAQPSYTEVLDARAGRVAMVRGFIATVTPDVLAASRENPHDPAEPETVLSCLHVILGEEWEHLRYAVRDLDAIEAGHAG